MSHYGTVNNNVETFALTAQRGLMFVVVQMSQVHNQNGASKNVVGVDSALNTLVGVYRSSVNF